MEKFKAIWNNPKHRKILILCILIVILVICIIVQLSKFEPPPPEGAKRVVICTKCKTKFVKRIKDLSDKNENICEKCGGEVSFVWKCDECDFEFPEVKMHISKKKNVKTMDKFQAIVESRRCPNCGSLATHPYSVNELKGKRKGKMRDIEELRKIRK